MSGLETSRKTSQSFLLWTASSLELRNLGRANQPLLHGPHTNYNGTRGAAQRSFMKIQCSGEMVPSSAGLAAPAEIIDRCIRDESKPASLGTPGTLAQGLRPQAEGTAPVPARLQAPPGLVPLPQLASRVGTMPALGLGRDLHGGCVCVWGAGGVLGAPQHGSGVPTRASTRCCSPLSHRKLHSQRYHTWGEALPPHPLPQGHFRDGTRSAPEWRQCLRSWGEKKKSTLMMAWPSSRDGADPKVLPQPLVIACWGDWKFPHSPGMPQDTMLSLGRETLSLSSPSCTRRGRAPELTSSARPASACRPGPPQQQQ